jgi:hypothetical protein
MPRPPAQREWPPARREPSSQQTKRPPVLPEAFLFALDLALFRRLQAGRVEPFGQMRGGVGTSCPQQQLLALPAGWEFVGPFAISFGLNAKPFFKRDRLFESSSLHDALPFIRSGPERYRRSRQLITAPKYRTLAVAYASQRNDATTNIKFIVAPRWYVCAPLILKPFRHFERLTQFLHKRHK